MLDWLEIQKQCFEWANTVALDATGHKVSYSGKNEAGIDVRVKIKEIVSGNGLYWSDSNHAMIVLEAKHSDNDVTIKVAESNYADKWQNPPGDIPWERRVACGKRTLTIKYEKDDAYLGTDAKADKRGHLKRYKAVDYTK